MYKIETYLNDNLKENTYHTLLDNGLNVYICKKSGFNRKIGMFGTKYGYVDNCFVDILTNKKTSVPDGIAHFLEHKLFEKEGDNALDMFSKIGVESNAYTTFDHTVYYFQTIDKFEKSIELLVKLIKEPYFTDENVKKEQGIIAQEIMMGDDDPNYMVYFNCLKAMYQKNNVKIDIAGTVDSIKNIDKELLYTCYNTFYNPVNMFFVIVGDVDVTKTIELIDKNMAKYEDNRIKRIKEVERFYIDEPQEVSQKEIIYNMDIYMPQICIGYKQKVVSGKETIKRALIADIVDKMYFSRLTDFYEKEYEKNVLSDEMILSYEATNTFSHIMLIAESLKIDELKLDLLEYVKKIKNEDVDIELFNKIKDSKIGSVIMESERISSSYKRIIDSILTDTDVYEDVEIINNLTVDDIKEFLNLLDENFMSISIINKR